jgi:hypothetical protein
MPIPTYPVQALLGVPDPACANVVQVPGGVCITFPGGAQLCVQTGIRTGDYMAMVEAFFSMINSTLMPLVPFFNILDVLIALFNCIQSVPKILVDPGALVDCIKQLAQAIAKILAMLPPLSIPRMIKGILLVIGLILTGFALEMQALIAQQQRILRAATAAAQPGNVHLQAVVNCATGNFDLQLQNLNAAMAPLNRLIGLINILLALVPGSPSVPSIGNLGSDAEGALRVLQEAGQTITEIANLIPVPA